MLGKLIKYEFKATARLLIPLYCALIGFAIINKLFIGNGFEIENVEFLNGIPFMITMAAYGITMVATMVVTLIIIIQRFYKNLLCDEGYLMNTLPISVWKNITSKLAVAFIWNVISGAVALLSIFILAYHSGIMNDINSGIKEIYTLAYNEFGSGINLIIIEFIIATLVQAVSGIIIIYTSISLGHLANKRKILCSFGAFIVLNMISSAISGMFTSSFVFEMNDISISSIQTEVLIMTIITIVLTAGFFATSNYILKNKLNLE
ncbi:ABC transporter permease [Clostridium vincentii]|uniref:ABC-2 family transporter protein n=1 Tax=Clostridium vincentii TaxID=52704 RepID=A0A2T0BFD8_9CLOT|nr:ABC transporter permease [Clostridium vincentii]PRR82626.1 hypothetical protein CLVI_15930 [Clostridium vincentii]